MAARRIAKREDLRETVARNMRILDAMAVSAGKPKQELSPSLAMKAKRKNKPRVDDPNDPIESVIQDRIVAMLRKHPKVKLVERTNSGKARETNADGSVRYVTFNTIYKVNGVRMRKADLDCTLVNGKRLVIECKRKGWTHPRKQSEVEQQNYIQHVLASTGYGMFATSVAEVEIYLASIAV